MLPRLHRRPALHHRQRGRLLARGALLPHIIRRVLRRHGIQQQDRGFRKGKKLLLNFSH